AEESIQLVPAMRMWLWQALSEPVKEVFQQNFPHYYRLFSEAARNLENELVIAVLLALGLDSEPSWESQDEAGESQDEGVQRIVEWLTQAAPEMPENMEDILIIYVEYVRLVPQAKTCIWQALDSWVKDAIATHFPEYYQVLSLEVTPNESSIVSSAESPRTESLPLTPT
ncbi:MAG: hypothetical protein ACRDEA_19380, partial [Microcystaceae cyanobacterium]